MTPLFITSLTMKTILAATDGSEPAQHALMVAAEYALKWEATLHILTVVPKITPMASPIENVPHQYLIPDLEEVAKAYERILKYSVKQIKKKYPGLEVITHLKVGRPSEQIVEQAEEIDCELVVVGSRGIGGITGWVLGSTSKKVVDQCNRQVLVIK